MLETIWQNIEYYTYLRDMHKKDVFRADRYGKNISLTSVIEIAEILDVPLELLFETDKEITLELAYVMVGKDLEIDRETIEKTVKFEREMKRIVEVFK